MARARAKKYKYKGETYRSNFELTTAKQLVKAGVKFGYEVTTYSYQDKLQRAECDQCGSKDIYTTRWYTPDFFFGGNVAVETKGIFTKENRRTMLAVREQHPDLDLRLVFMRNNKIHRSSKTRYSDWAEKNGFKYSLGTIPDEWIEEFKLEQDTNK